MLVVVTTATPQFDHTVLGNREGGVGSRPKSTNRLSHFSSFRGVLDCTCIVKSKKMGVFCQYMKKCNTLFKTCNMLFEAK